MARRKITSQYHEPQFCAYCKEAGAHPERNQVTGFTTFRPIRTVRESAFSLPPEVRARKPATGSDAIAITEFKTHYHGLSEARRRQGEEEELTRNAAAAFGKGMRTSTAEPETSEDEDESLGMRWACEDCGAENTVRAPKGYKLVRSGETEEQVDPRGQRMRGKCRACGEVNKVLPPRGTVLMTEAAAKFAAGYPPARMRGSVVGRRAAFTP